MNALRETMTFLSDALAADPVTALAHCAAWLDPVGLMTEADDYDFIGEDDPVEMALWVTRRAFPDVYADAIRALRAGAGHIEIDNLICAGLSEHGLPADNIEYLGWGIPLPAYGVTLEDADFYPANPEAARVLAAFGVSPEPNPYRIDIPQFCYTAGHLLGADLIEHPDPDWQNVGWALGHLWSCTGNSVVDWDWETLAEIEPLGWSPDEVEFAVEIVREADEITAKAHAGLKWLCANESEFETLQRNIQLVYHTLTTKGKDHAAQLQLEWSSPDDCAQRGTEPAA